MTDFDEAWQVIEYQVIEYYGRRNSIRRSEIRYRMPAGGSSADWRLVCRLEARLYRDAKALEAVAGVVAEAVAGIVSVLAVRLVPLKTVATAQPELPAERPVPGIWLTRNLADPESG